VQKDHNQKFVYKAFLFIGSFVLLSSILFLLFGNSKDQTFTGKFGFEDNYNPSINPDSKLTTFQDITIKQTQTIITYKTSDYLFFEVNKSKSLGYYYPDDLVNLPNQYVTKATQVSKLIQSDLENMLNQAKTDGIDLKVTSGYRSYATQEALFNLYISQERKNHPSFSQDQLVAIVNQYSAVPGHSEHQLGTTVDLVSSENGYQLVVDENSAYQKWIAANASKYNFKISYPKGNPEYIYEPWHLRWWPTS